jgi:hypothetical protein
MKLADIKNVLHKRLSNKQKLAIEEWKSTITALILTPKIPGISNFKGILS